MVKLDAAGVRRISCSPSFAIASFECVLNRSGELDEGGRHGLVAVAIVEVPIAGRARWFVRRPTVTDAAVSTWCFRPYVSPARSFKWIVGIHSSYLGLTASVRRPSFGRPHWLHHAPPLAQKRMGLLCWHAAKGRQYFFDQ